MRVLEMYAIYDKKGERFDTPFFTLDEVNAKRKFKIDFMRSGTLINTFPEDFELVRIASFNVEKGELIKMKQSILEGKQLPKEVTGYEISNETQVQ